MGLNIKVDKYAITQIDSEQFAVGIPYTSKDKNGKEHTVLQNARYYGKLDLALTHLAHVLVNEKDIKTIGEFVKANEEAKEKLEKLFSKLPE